MSNKGQFRSGFERSIATNLRQRKVAFEYETLELPYKLEKVYRPDFILPNGIIVEAKGLFDDPAKRKMLAVKACHPDKDIRMLFMDASKKVRKGAKMTYAGWADKHGFPWAEGIKIPQEWIDE